MSQKSTFWCNTCQVPLIKEECEVCRQKGKYLSSGDLKPVFREELDCIHHLTGEFIHKWARDLSLWESKHRYFYKGKKVAQVSGFNPNEKLQVKHYNEPDDARQLDFQFVNSSSTHPRGKLIERIERANKSALNKLEYRALTFIRETAEKYSNRTPVVSFSGGKDSALVSYLVRKAFGTASIIHLFADTTLESPETYEYISRFKKSNPKLPFLVVKPEADFFDYCDAIGPPSRIHRWCCTTHKTTPLSSVLNAVNGRNGVLTFDGIRHFESPSRSSYHSIREDSKISHQIMASPIIELSDTEVWLYILTRELDVNLAYKRGFTRVGCLPCPFNSHWSEFLNNYYHADYMKGWYEFLKEYAIKTERSKPEEYVLKGAWKSRAGGRGLENKKSIIEKEPCTKDSNSFGYFLESPWNEVFWEYLKPFGELIFIYDDEIIARCVLKDKNGDSLIFLEVSRPRDHLRVTFLVEKNKRLLRQRFERQLRKFQCCILCGGCASACPTNAIETIGGYSIDSNTCINCLKCITDVPGGCYAADSLHV